ncbi:hypothetical protein TrST_g5970 [Triparma strigata]|uniref:Tyrosine-protein kinase ephrin type A/B receptor-like domain-containing protein n=1 Tax=Triparma strigata TaxID=1606541 RepID=A0A9W7EQ90_9STRA|nr:hypothetical protein TrST_g5970 [Triparma strigata]
MSLFCLCLICVLTSLLRTVNAGPWDCPGGETGQWGDPCPAGKYCFDDDSLSFNTCCSCPTGSYCPGHKTTRYSFGDGNCAGSNQGGDNAPKTPCPAGKFNGEEGLNYCTYCDAGKATPMNEGATECASCGAGKYSEEGSNVAGCVDCPKGKYAPEPEAEACVNCDVGKYSENDGSASCADCPASTNAPEGSFFCNSCGVGEYGVHDAGCETCQPGKYNSFPGLSCVDCAVGRYISANATAAEEHDEQEDCLPCPAGKQAQSAGSEVCTQCPAGSYKEEAFGEPCDLCKAGKASKKVGSQSRGDCANCDDSLVQYDKLIDVGMVSCKTINCEKGEYLSDTGCKECNIAFSVSVCVGGVVLLLLACFYVEKVATERMKLLQLKILSTFFQTSELTTHINIQWPTIAFWSLPFRVPSSDAACLTPNFWDSRWSFLVFIYAPLAFFMFLYVKWRKLPIGSSREKKLQQLGVFLLVLWYSPVLLAAASMYDCVEDVENGGGWFLRADTSTPCQYKTKEVSMAYIKSLDYIDWHAAFVALFIGIGFPLYIFTTLRRHRRKGKLNASSPYTALFEWYIPSQCTFETAQMLRKALLILAGGIPLSRVLPKDLELFGWSTSLKLERRIQAYSILGVNLVFFLYFLLARPMIKEPSRIFKKLNLFSTAEGMSILITVCGNCLALFGTFQYKQAYNIGVAFAYMNMTFAVLFIVLFAVEIRRTNLETEKSGAVGLQGMQYQKLSRGLSAAVKNWNMHKSTMDRMMNDEEVDAFTKTQLLKESDLILNRVKVEVTDELKVKEEKLAASFAEMNALEEDIGYASLRLRNQGISGEESMKNSKVKKFVKKLEEKEKKHLALASGVTVTGWLDGLCWVFDKMKEDENWAKQWKSAEEAGETSKDLLKVIAKADENEMIHMLKLLEGEVMQTSKRKLEMVDLSRRKVMSFEDDEDEDEDEDEDGDEDGDEENPSRSRESSSASSYFEAANPMKRESKGATKRQWDLSGSMRHLINSEKGEKKAIGMPPPPPKK